MEGHYVSLSAEPMYGADMKPYNKGNSNKLLVGIGEINPNAEIGKVRYDTSYSGYAPKDEKEDQST